MQDVAKHSVHSNQLDVFSHFLALDDPWIKINIFRKEHNQKQHRIQKYNLIDLILQRNQRDG